MAHAADTARVECVQPNFRDSKEATFRRYLREAVRESNLTRGEKALTLAFINHWFVHRHKGAVHPGRKKLAKRTGASLRAVNYTFNLLREFKAIEAVAYEGGNEAGAWGKATEYTVDTVRLLALCEASKAELQAWRKAKMQPDPRNTGCKNARSKGAKIAPRNNPCTVIPFPSHRVRK